MLEKAFQQLVKQFGCFTQFKCKLADYTSSHYTFDMTPSAVFFHFYHFKTDVHFKSLQCLTK